MWEFAHPHPPSLQSTQEEPSEPKAGSQAQPQQQYNIKGATDQMTRLRHKPIVYTRDTETQTVRIPQSHLECERTHVAKTMSHKIEAY